MNNVDLRFHVRLNKTDHNNCNNITVQPYCEQLNICCQGVIMAHTCLYNPAVSHYQRHSAPNKMFLA